VSAADDRAAFLSGINDIYQSAVKSGASVPPFVFVLYPVPDCDRTDVFGNVLHPRHVVSGLNKAIHAVMDGRYNGPQ